MAPYTLSHRPGTLLPTQRPAGAVTFRATGGRAAHLKPDSRLQGPHNLAFAHLYPGRPLRLPGIEQETCLYMPLEIGPAASVSLWILKWLWNLAPATPNYDLRETLLSQEPTRRKPQKCPQMNSLVQLQSHSLSVILTVKPEVDQWTGSRPLPAGSRNSPATLGPGGDMHLHVRGEAQRQRH